MIALTDAIAEVYASVFGPDPIEYRARRGFLDLHEEMAILIQEVVGRKIGPYFLPVFSGVAFCNNELRWSPRIRREDGLLRLVMGLGTRAVDRLGDDYPVLVAPGQPGLRLHQTRDEAVYYSPKKIDVIDLQSGGFETVDVSTFLAAHGERMPMLRQLISFAGHDRLRRPVGLIDLTKETAVVTFEGLIADTPFLGRMRSLLQLLREAMGTPADLEFAHDGEHLYLLQCRPQGMSEGTARSRSPAIFPPSGCCSPPTATFRTAGWTISPTSSTSIRRPTAASTPTPCARWAGPWAGSIASGAASRSSAPAAGGAAATSGSAFPSPTPT